MSSFGLAIIAAVFWGTAALFDKLGLGGTDPTVGVWGRSLGVVLGALAMTVMIPDLTQRVSAAGWRAMLFLMTGGFLASIVGQIFFYRALKVGEMGRVASIGGSWPLIAFILSVIFLNEAPTLRKVAGIALVITGASLLK